MKHEQIFRKTISDIHIEWMDESTEQEQEELDNQLILEYGEQMDKEIDYAIDIGCSEDDIYGIIQKFFLAYGGM